MRLAHLGKLLTLTMVVLATLHAQQVADTAFRPPIQKPAFPMGKGPMVLIDEAHFNFHTSSGRYLPFRELLRRDGYLVNGSAAKFTTESLNRTKVLVISNALNEKNQEDWTPPHPSAFTSQEIAVVQSWVSNGGALLLIADHKPFAAAAEELGKAFGIRFISGYAMIPKVNKAMVFRKSDGTLRNHEITTGIDAVATFTGSSFQIDRNGQPLLVFGPDVVSMASPNDPNPLSVAGHLQGAVLPCGKGRVAVFGEAAMFSAQLGGPYKLPMGMNHPSAKQNPQFLLNVIHWLTGLP